MFKLIEKLRAKSERTKKLFAFSIAFFFSGLIFVVWLSVIYPSFKQKQDKLDYVSKLEPSPIGTITEALGGGFSQIGEQFGRLKDAVSSLTSAPAYYSTTSKVMIESTSTSEF
jgi:hypothetical protein